MDVIESLWIKNYMGQENKGPNPLYLAQDLAEFGHGYDVAIAEWYGNLCRRTIGYRTYEKAETLFNLTSELLGNRMNVLVVNTEEIPALGGGKGGYSAAHVSYIKRLGSESEAVHQKTTIEAVSPSSDKPGEFMLRITLSQLFQVIAPGQTYEVRTSIINGGLLQEQLMKKDRQGVIQNTKIVLKREPKSGFKPGEIGPQYVEKLGIRFSRDISGQIGVGVYVPRVGSDGGMEMARIFYSQMPDDLEEERNYIVQLPERLISAATLYYAWQTARYEE